MNGPVPLALSVEKPGCVAREDTASVALFRSAQVRDMM